VTVDPVAIEQAADEAWPAAEQVTLGPWRLRATHGVTRRANSVFTAGHEEISSDRLPQLVAEAETFYTRRGLPSVFQMSDATGAKELDGLLAERGYVLEGESEVWVRTASALTQCETPTWDLRLDGEPDDAWMDGAFYDTASDRRGVYEQIVRRAPRPRVFASAIVAGDVVGCGMAVSARNLCGLFCMATQPAHRRRGIGSTLVRRLCEWAGDAPVYLQVMRGNAGAMSVYRRAGFVPAYRYHYRTR